MLLSADCGVSGFPFYHLFYTASHGILVKVLLLILLLTAWDGRVYGLQGCGSAWTGSVLLHRDFPEPLSVLLSL